MAAVIMDGRMLAEKIEEELKKRVMFLAEKGLTPCLCAVLAGNDPASKIYVRNKEKACARLGIRSLVCELPESVPEDELLSTIDRLNLDDSVDSVLVQLPLPAHLNSARILNHIAPEKDADGFHALNQGLLLSGQPGVLPCTPNGIMYMLRSYGVPLSGKNAVVVGRSNIVGKPAALLLLQENCTVTLCHSRTKDLREHTSRADILIAAVGRPEMIRGDMVKPGAAVVDVGINRTDAGLKGDVCFEEVSKIAGWISPVPGGVGKMTVSMLMENVISAAERKLNA